VHSREKSQLSPIGDIDITNAASFLHHNMNQRFSPAEWERGLKSCWLENAPNHGFKLTVNGEIVGVICAIYSEQEIDGRKEKFCNPHTWCVLEPFRAKSVNLVLSLIRQPGFHFTMLSPNREGEKIFSFLGFKSLDRHKKLLFHVPSLCILGRVRISYGENISSSHLSPVARTYFEDHWSFEWLRFLEFERDGRSGFLIFKQSTYKRLPCANILYISDKVLFENCWSSIRSWFLLRQGLFTSSIDDRMLVKPPLLSCSIQPGSAKFYMSESLSAEKIEYIYSELLVMDL